MTSSFIAYGLVTTAALVMPAAPASSDTFAVRMRSYLYESGKLVPADAWPASSAAADILVDLLADPRLLTPSGKRPPLDRFDDEFLRRDRIDAAGRQRVTATMLPLLDDPACDRREANQIARFVALHGGPPALALLSDLVDGRRVSDIEGVVEALSFAAVHDMTAAERTAAFDGLVRLRKPVIGSMTYHTALARVDCDRAAAWMAAEEMFSPTHPEHDFALHAAVTAHIAGRPAQLGRYLDALKPSLDSANDAERLMILLARADAAAAEQRCRAMLETPPGVDDPTRRRWRRVALRGRLEAARVNVSCDYYDDRVFRAVAVPKAILEMRRVFKVTSDVNAPDMGRLFAERNDAQWADDLAALRAVGATEAADAVQAALDAVGPGGRAASWPARVQAVRALGDQRVTALTDAIRRGLRDGETLLLAHQLAHAAEIKPWVDRCAALVPADPTGLWFHSDTRGYGTHFQINDEQLER